MQATVSSDTLYYRPTGQAVSSNLLHHIVFSVQQPNAIARYMPSPVRLSVRLSHG